MKESKKITMWIEWSDEDAAFIGYCPQFFPYGAVCHAHTEAKAVAKLASIVRDELRPCTHKIRSNVRFDPKATELLRGSEMTRRAKSGGTPPKVTTRSDSPTRQ